MKYNRLHWLPIICMTTVLISPHGDRAARADGVKLEDVQKQFGAPTMRVARPKQPPVVDGRLDDLAWQEVEAVTLHAAVGGWTSPSQKSEARVLADERAIYFAVQCFEASPETIRSAAQVQMGKVNTGDTVELFLDPGHHEKFGEYFHVAVNPADEVYTARGLDSKAWSPNISARTAKDDDGWTVEVAIAMKDLGLDDGEIPKVWGLNVNRQRPELGVALPKSAQVSGHARYWPMVRPLDEPKKYRDGEYSGWAPTYSDYSYSDSRPFHFPQRFGHAVLEVGSRDVSPPPRLFEVIYKSDFDSGETGAMANGELRDENFRGVGKSYASKPQGLQTLYLREPLEDLQDTMLMMAFQLPQDGRLYHYARTPDGWKCGACRHEFFITPVAAAGRTVDQSGRILFPTFDLYDTHADKMAWKSWGRLWKGPGPWSMVTGYLSEVSESAVIFPGTDWAVLRMRLGEFRRYAGRSPKAPEIPGQILVPRDLDYPGGLVFFPAPGPLLISDLVIFRGADVEPPAPPGDVQTKTVHEAIHLSWQRAEDNTLTAYYRVYAGDEMLVETHRLSTVVPHDWPQGRAMTVVAVDFYDNVSAPAKFSP